MNPVALYVLSLATCVIGYFSYLKFAVPLIENPAARPVQLAHQQTQEMIPTIHRNRMIPLLPPQAWELSDCKTLITSTGTILFKELEPQPDGTVKLSPFTLMTNVGEAMLLNPTGVPAVDQKTPLVLRTAEGAMLTLSKPFNEALQGSVEMESARLLGEVDIYRPPSGPSKADVLHVLTRNVQIDRNRVYTLDTLDKPFLFSYGPHRGRGRNLIIDLTHDEDSVAGRQNISNVSGIQRLELAYLDRLRIVPTAAKVSTTGSDASDDQSASNLFGGKDAPLDVSCKGPCVFDFTDQTVSFTDQVVVKKVGPESDSIVCDLLKIKFDENPLADESNAELASVSGKPPSDESKKKLGIQSLVAVGSPVIVNAISRPAKITAARLTYDATTDRISGIAGPSSGGVVTLVAPDLQYSSRQLSCKLDTGVDGGTTLDAISASGPGQLVKLGKTPADELLVHWTESLNMVRDRNDPSIQTLAVKGDTHVQFQETSSVDAQRIDLRLKQLEQAKGKTEFAIMEIVANQQVRIATPDITGTTDRLIASFPEPIKLKSHQVSRPRYSVAGQLQVADQRTLAPTQFPARPRSGFQVNAQFSQHAQGRAFSAAKPNQAKFDKPKDSGDKHLNFSGQRVEISILEAGGDRLSFDKLLINGEVVVSQSVANSPVPSETFKMRGDHLYIVPQPGDERFRIELISNTVASIDSPEYTINGQKIYLDQTENKLWVEGPGRFKFNNDVPASGVSPTQAAGRGGFAQSASWGGLGANSKTAKPPGSFEASWRNGMIFDGKKIYLEGEVVSKTEQADGPKNYVTQANCGQMSVALNRDVDFEQLKQADGVSIGSQDVKPTELIFIDQVDPTNQVFGVGLNPANFNSVPRMISNQVYDSSGKLIQQQTISSKRVRVDMVSQDIVADGPGWVSTHDFKTPGASRDSKHPLAGMAGKHNDAGKPITFVRANFASRMTIEAAKNKMTLGGRIRIVHLATDDWGINVDPDQIPTALQSAATLLTCEQLTLARWQPRDAAAPTHEMIADGNVRIFGDTIDLSSNRVSYNQANDMLVVNGTNRTAANIRYRKAAGPKRAWQEFSGEKFEYQIGSQTVNINGLQKGEAIRLD